MPTPQELIPLTGSNSNFSLIQSVTGLTSDFFEPFIEIASNMHANSFNNKAIAQCEYTFFKSKFSLAKKMKFPNPLKGEVFVSKRFHQSLELKPDASNSMMPTKTNKQKQQSSPHVNSQETIPQVSCYIKLIIKVPTESKENDLSLMVDNIQGNTQEEILDDFKDA